MSFSAGMDWSALARFPANHVWERSGQGGGLPMLVVVHQDHRVADATEKRVVVIGVHRGKRDEKTAAAAAAICRADRASRVVGGKGAASRRERRRTIRRAPLSRP